MNASAAGIALRCEKLSKRFGALTAVDGVSLAVPTGTVLGIGGPNGAGKTTLFDLLTGIQRPSSGSYWLGTTEATGRGSDELCHMGLARTFQADAAFDSMSALENVLVATYFGRQKRMSPGFKFGDEARQRAAEALEHVGLAHRAHIKVGSMPVLERKLVMLAGALAMNPSVLMMDEPVGGLTPDEVEIFARALDPIVKANITIVVIEHVMRFLLKISNSIVIMHQGRMIFSGPKEEMLSNHEIIKVYLGETTAQHLREAIEEGKL